MYLGVEKIPYHPVALNRTRPQTGLKLKQPSMMMHRPRHKAGSGTKLEIADATQDDEVDMELPTVVGL
jgi:hypothetical protein